MTVERTSSFLMANLGVEVSRLISAKKNNELSLVQAALARAARILSKIKKHFDMKSRLEEINILDMAVQDIASPNPLLDISAKNLQSYFTPFVMRTLQS